jgi:trans-aconitate 2-methyltransferase
MPADDPSWNPALYDDKHSFVWRQAASLVELLAPVAGERIVDLGCGTGHLTAELVRRGAIVVGFDHSADMVATARKNYPELTFLQADARDFAVEAPVDAVFSNAALHWVPEAERVIASIRRALRPGGRFVAEFGGKGNVRAIVAGLDRTFAELGLEPPSTPWFFPALGQYARLLEQGGLETVYAVLFDRPTPLEGPTGLRHWIEMFGQEWLAQVPAELRGRFFDRLDELVAPALRKGETWVADYRRLRVVARRV